MVHAGIKELIIISQDTTRYGMDLYRRKPMLIELLKKIDQVPGDFTYRLLYFYPDIITKEHLHHMKDLKKFIPYFDVPLQHISSTVLKRMGRFYEERSINTFLDTIKKYFPVRFIRTNLMLGFPGETKEDFMKLKKFVQKMDFDNIALFEYHDEPFAASSKLDKKVPDAEIRKRFLEMKKIVDQLLDKKAKARKGKEDIGYVMEILKSGKVEKLIVRPRLHAPEIDSYDEIPMKNVIAMFEKKKTVHI